MQQKLGVIIFYNYKMKISKVIRNSIGELTEEAVFVHFELQSELSDIVNEKGEGGHQTQCWQVNEG